MKLLVDSNFLIDLVRFKIGLDSLKELQFEIGKFEIIILKQVFDELKKIANSKKKEAKFAKIAIDWVKENGKIEEFYDESADKAILNFCDKNTIVATNDKKLRKKLKEKGVKTIYIRARKKIEVEN